jgi:hypothetical protein
MVAGINEHYAAPSRPVGRWYAPFSSDRIFFMPGLFAKTCRSDVLSTGQTFRSYISTVGKLQYILYCFTALLRITHNGRRCKEAFGFFIQDFLQLNPHLRPAQISPLIKA